MNSIKIISTSKYLPNNRVENSFFNEKFNLDDDWIFKRTGIKNRYFTKEENIKLINNLKNIGINMTYKGEKTLNNPLISNKKFVITGTISFMTRDEIKNILEKYDGTAVESVSKKTDVVIVGDSPGSKYEKAQKLGIEIWDENKLKEVIDNL